MSEFKQTVVLHVSADGDAQFTVDVNGHQVGDMFDTMASHTDHQIQDITLTGDFGLTGPGDVEVNFLNADAPANLYVESIDVNTNHFLGSTATNTGALPDSESRDPTAAVMDVNGTATFNTTGSGPINDGSNDILWRNDDGRIGVWHVDDTARNPAVLGTVDDHTNFAGTGDFNGDGNRDILWRTDSGDVFYWQNDGADGHSVVNLASGVGSEWHIVGTGNFDGDGKTDILWLNDNGTVSTWDVNGADHTPAALGTVSSAWHVVGTGDFDGDGKTDILWRNDDGTISTWRMDGANHTTTSQGTVSSAWHVAGTGDFDGNGKTDVLWRNDDGTVSIWHMDGANHTPVALTTPSNDWQIVGTADVNGDGKTDIIWQNVNGQISAWEMNGDTYTPVAISTPVTHDWHTV